MSTTLARPFSADFSRSLNVGPSTLVLPAIRQRPKSQTFRSSPLAGPALSISELSAPKKSANNANGKAKAKDDRDSEQRRPLSSRACSAPTVTLAELGAVRTTAGVSFPHRQRPRPQSLVLGLGRGAGAGGETNPKSDKRASTPGMYAYLYSLLGFLFFFLFLFLLI